MLPSFNEINNNSKNHNVNNKGISNNNIEQNSIKNLDAPPAMPGDISKEKIQPK
jgi:hypothetical protein